MTNIMRSKALIVAAAVLAVAAVLALSGCASGQTGSSKTSQASESAYTFTDDLGNQVTVDKPERVVACMGSFANTWELAGGTLVGATDDAMEDYAISSPDVQSVGAFTAPNMEKIISLRPDFVIMTGSSSGQAGSASQTDMKDSLEAAGISVAYFKVTTFDDYLRMLRICCDITGRDDLYQQNGAQVASAIDALKAKVSKTGTAPNVLLMTTYSGGTRVQSSSSQTGAMLKDLGANNLVDQNQSLLKDFSLESIIALNPDYVFVVPMGNDDAAALKNLQDATTANPAWAQLSAVQNGRYIILDKSLFLYKPNARWADAYTTLYGLLYG